MKKLAVSITALIFLVASSSALYVWSDSTPSDVKEDYNPTNYCQSEEISSENYDSFCVEISSNWNNVVLSGEGFNGLDNILTLTRKALNNDKDRDNGELTFAETNMILSLTSCESSGVETVGECIKERGSEFGLSPGKLIDPSELNSVENPSSETDETSDSSSDTSDSSDTEDTSSEIGNSSSDLSAPKGWSYEGVVEPERFGVDGSGVMVLEAEKCGKIYYEKEFKEGEQLEFDLSFVAENWEGKAGLWYTGSGGDLVLDDQSIGETTVPEPSDLNREGTVEFTQGATGPVQIGFSADAAICDQVGNAELRVDRVD
jgi:hypothetical protein